LALSGEDQGYKPMVKSFGGQWESEGVVVPLIGVRHNASGGKGPCFDHAGEVGKCEGMAGFARSNYLGKPLFVVADGPLWASPVKVRGLQRVLWAAAEQFEGRGFYALCDRVYGGEVLWEVWERVGKNKGAAGVGRVALAVVADYGVGRMLCELCWDFCGGGCIAWRLRVGWRYRNHEAVSGCWGYPWCETGWLKRRPGSCWN
jgi:RNA-directed DNA polymerase